MNALTQLAADLSYAAAGGAEHLADDLVATARIETEVGLQLKQAGRAYLSAGAAAGTAHRTAQGATGAAPGVVAEHMAERAATEGAALALGQR